MWLLQEAGGEAPRWIDIQGGPISGEGAAGKKSQMIKFPFAVVKGFLSTLVLKDGGFYWESFLSCVNKYVFMVGRVSMCKAP